MRLNRCCKFVCPLYSYFSLYRTVNPTLSRIPKAFSTCDKKFCSTLPNTFKKDKYYFHNNVSDSVKDVILQKFRIVPEFVTEKEEIALMKEIEPYLKRLRYEFDHWDDAIHGFKETERLNWTEENESVLRRLREFVCPNVEFLEHTHILDLSEKGHIKPHVDSVRFCGDIIAGISLLSDCIMRLVSCKNSADVIDVYLERRSLYIMEGPARYDYTHEVLPNEESKFDNRNVKRTRRVSIICRSKPSAPSP